MKKTILILIAGILFFYSTSKAVTNIAVVQFSSRGISQEQAAILTDRLRVELVNTGEFKVFERDMMEKILEEQGLQQSGIISNEEIVQFGKLIGVSEIVGGTINRLNSIISVNAKLVNVETGEIVKTAMLDSRGSVDKLLVSGMRKIARQLANVSDEESDEDDDEVDVNYADESESGMITPFQLALVPGLQLFPTSSTVFGVCVGCIGSINRNIYGVDVGLVNKVHKDVFGLQAGLVNQSKHVVGMQVGLVNTCENMFGMQVGLVNIISRNRSGAKFFPFINVGFSLN